MPPVTSALGFQNFLSGKLTADCLAAATDVFIDTIPSVSQGFLVIDPFTPASREVIFFTSKTAAKVSTPATGGRGVDGTSAVFHANGTTYIMAPIGAMFTALQNGSASTDPIRTDTFTNFIVSGGVVAQSAGLVGTFSNIIFWIAGVRYSGSSIANKTYTASKDTYVDITGNSDGTVTVVYTEVANGATAPALTSGYLRVAKVVTGAAAITSVVQTGNDALGNLIYNLSPTPSTAINLLGAIGVLNNPTTSNYGTTETSLQSLTMIIPAGCTKVLVLGSCRLQSQDATNKDITARVDYDATSSTMTAVFTSVNTFNGSHVSIVDQIAVTPGSHTFRLLTRASNGSASTSSANIFIIPVKE